MTRTSPRRNRSRSTGSDGPAGRDPTPLDVAAAILRTAPRTEAELHARLVAKGYQPRTAAAAVERCKELGWVSDERLAHDRARTLRLRGSGSLRIAADLAARGLPDAVVEAAVTASLDGDPETAWARRVLERSPPCPAAAAWRLLVRRGFPDEVAADVVGQVDEPCD